MNHSCDRSRTAVCTIVSKNYLAFARTLMDSVAAVHPDWQRFVMLVDEVDDYFAPSEENFELVHVADLSLPEVKKFLFRYDLLEVNTAVKPWLLKWLFERVPADRVVYLDPDIRVYAPMTEMGRLLDDGASMVLTPHLLAELNDERRPSDRDILQAGCYNLGFLALGRHRDVPRFLSWWQSKLTYDCRVDLAQGLFVDQKWMDLAPGLFADVAILRHPGYNVAYWNLNHRLVEFDKEGPTAAGQPLVFFHFSGLDPLKPAALSKHQNRYRLKDLGACATLVNEYCQEVIDRGWTTCSQWPYAFGNLSNGTPIRAIMRRYYRRHPEVIRRVGSDPFHHAHDYLNAPCDGGGQPLVTRLMQSIWESRQDLRDAFPNIQSAWREEFASHFVEFVAKQEGIPEAFVDPVRESLDAWRASERGADTSRIALRIATPEDDNPDHAAARFIRATVKAVLIVTPLPRSPERIRTYYRAMRPIGFLLPSSIRHQLKRDMLRMFHRKLSTRHANRLSEMIRSLMRLVRRLLPLGARAAMQPAPIATALTQLHHLPSNPRRQLSNDGPGGLTNGINIVGYFEAESGVGESARLSAQAATVVDLPFSTHDITLQMGWRPLDGRRTPARNQPAPHAVNLLHVNADQTIHVRGSLGSSFFLGRYNIGVWHWELPTFPERWIGAFDVVDEIWAPSRFIQDSISARSPRPVVKIPHAIRFSVSPEATRRDFGLPGDDFLFLMMYDVQSFKQRKNPEGAIEAFRRAFGSESGVTLVVKVNDSQRQPERDKHLSRLLRGMPNVRMLDEKMDRQRTYDLLSVCDCAVSLHRAEGFGLVLAEAMFLGKPVIATGWSGNMEFMTPENSCPVEYHMVRLDRDIGPYERGESWAEPNLDHAAEMMTKMAANAGWARSIGAAGQATIRNEFSPERIGELYRQRLNAILKQHSAPPPSVVRAAA